MRILLVEDDELLGDGLAAGLRHCGYQVDWLLDGETARTALEIGAYTALVLDLGLPCLDGMALLRELRAEGNTIPVLILTARDSIWDKVSGLDSGADDYLTKPVDLDELAAHLRALIRRDSGNRAPLLKVRHVELDPAIRQIRVDGELVEVSAKEFAILEILMHNVGKVISRTQLRSALYGTGGGGGVERRRGSHSQLAPQDRGGPDLYHPRGRLPHDRVKRWRFSAFPSSPA